MTKFGKEGARYAYMLIKLRFMSLMRERRTRPEWNQQRQIAFVCDEYQAIVDSITDTDFWDKSPLQWVHGHRLDAGHCLTSLRGQRSARRRRDPPELPSALDLQNRGRRDHRSRAKVAGHGRRSGHFHQQQQQHWLFGEHSRKGRAQNVSHSRGSNEGDSTTLQRQQLFESNDFRSLATDYGLFIGNIGDHSTDEVIYMQPLYIKD